MLHDILPESWNGNFINNTNTYEDPLVILIAEPIQRPLALVSIICILTFAFISSTEMWMKVLLSVFSIPIGAITGLIASVIIGMVLTIFIALLQFSALILSPN